MATLRLEEVAIQSIIAKLQKGWPDRIAAINIEKDDGVVCVAPDPADYFVGRQSQLAHWPACFVMAGPTKYNEQGAHSMTTTQEIRVWVMETDQTGPGLATRLLRQVRAIVECLYDDAPQEQAYVPGGSVVGPYRIFPVKTQPGNVFGPSGPDAWRGSFLIVFRAEQEEM